MGGEPIGYRLRLLTQKCSVFIPFSCRRCGECCRKVGVEFAYFDPFVTADYLKTIPEDVIETYLGGRVISRGEDGIRFETAGIRLPCPFLKDNECVIYPIRPGPCQAFPIATDFGDGGIGCPGKKEALRAVKILGRGVPYILGPYKGKKIEDIDPQKKLRLYMKYLRASPCQESIDAFCKINRIRASEK